MAFVWPVVSPMAGNSLDVLQSYDFDVFAYSDDELLVFTMGIFQQMGMLGFLQIDSSRLQAFFLAVRSHYTAGNAFHNFKHGFSVLHVTYLFLQDTKAVDKLSSLDVLGLLISSLCHDIAHPGNTNQFEIDCETERALIHNDISVLENHHAYVTFSLLRDPKANLFEAFPLSDKRELRETIVTSILATDMADHSEAGKSLCLVDSIDSLDRDERKDRLFLCKVIIHSADLSGQVFKWKVARVWEELISLEFAEQARQEEKRGIEGAPFMRDLNDRARRGKLQVGFIDFVLSPWWRNIPRVFTAMQARVDELDKNRQYYEQISEGHDVT